MRLQTREKDPPPPCGLVFLPIRTIFELNRCIKKTFLLTKFHKDWAKKKTAPPPGCHAKNVTSRVKKPPPHGGHVFLPIQTIFELNRRIQETNVLTKFHEDWNKHVASRVFTCFHYIHIEKTAPPPGGHVFSPIWAIFELVQDINETNVSPGFMMIRQKL
ncbi:hypothetical protein DPMN_080528 [Dreissena polymorpha]|uniref:Uncharacterized protein n=1 Tax=Dreissena polymorpha TaxID=45954 RepID=A0A9D4BR08_DREPO|nr:hypothetical protein DPMN_080528 [Dreissena polymorpha]